MNEFKLFKECVSAAGKGDLRMGSFTRYILILNNYKKGRSLSEIEQFNNQDNEPRSFFLKILAEGFNLKIDLNSSLFEGRLNLKKEDTYNDSLWFFERFFERLSLMRKAHIDISVSDLSMGSLFFADNYGDKIIESNIPYINVHGLGCTTTEFTLYKYKKEVVINLIDFLVKQDPSRYRFNNQLKERAISRMYEQGDKQVKEVALNALVEISHSYKSDFLEKFFKDVYDKGVKDGDLLSILKS